MDKKSAKIIVNVVLGICLFLMLTTFAGMIYSTFSATLGSIVIYKDMEGLTDASVWMPFALCCILVPTFFSYAFAYFGTKKIFNTAAAVLSIVTTLLTFSFIIVLTKKWLDDAYYLLSYTVLSAQFVELLVTLLIADAYFLYQTVKSFLPTKVAPAVAVGEEKVEEITEVDDNEED